MYDRTQNRARHPAHNYITIPGETFAFRYLQSAINHRACYIRGIRNKDGRARYVNRHRLFSYATRRRVAHKHVRTYARTHSCTRACGMHACATWRIEMRRIQMTERCRNPRSCQQLRRSTNLRCAMTDGS